MSLLSDYKGNVRFWLKSYLFLGVAVLTVAMLIYSNHLIRRMHEHSETTSRLFARYVADVLFEVSDDGSLAGLRDIIRESNLPIIITVLDGRPFVWHRVPVDERTEEDFQMLITMDVDNPPTPKLRKLVELYREFDGINDPIPIRVLGANSARGYVHFGESPLQRELRVMPFVMLGIFLVFMGIAIQALRQLKLSEQRSIWVGLAKETANQLGTPLSALMGWVQLIRDRAHEKHYTEIESSVEEMEVDLERLRKVTDRFSKIGSAPELSPVFLAQILERTVEYFHRRLPSHGSAATTVTLEPVDVPAVRANEELIEWVFENLIKNALDAIGDGGGSVEISAGMSGNHVEVRVKDTGRGVSPGLRERIFRPGFTTKKRGWGLGLALTQRIVEEYHDGSIRLADSKPGHGATFVVKLPVA
jgi:hypothetical protein